MKLKDSSEIREAARLVKMLMEPVPSPATCREEAVRPENGIKDFCRTENEFADVSRFKGDRLENELGQLCRRGGFSASVVTDSHGLPLGVFGSPVETEIIGAAALVLGDALEKAARLMNGRNSNNISIDINYMDKIVLRSFVSEGNKYYFMVICPQDRDERSDLDLSVDQIIEILK